MKELALCSVILCLTVACSGGSSEAQGDEGQPAVGATLAGADPSEAANAVAASPAGAQDCAPLDVPLVAYENDEEPFVVQIEQPEGWVARPGGSGGVLQLFDGENLVVSEYEFRFNAMGPVDPVLMTQGWKEDDVSEVELEDGGKLLIHSASPLLVSAAVPTPDGKAYMVNGGLTQNPTECTEAAAEVLGKIIRGLRPSSP